MKEYNILDCTILERYCHPAMDWYIKHHMAMIDGTLD